MRAGRLLVSARRVCPAAAERGSIPGEEIERATFDASLKTLLVELKGQGDVPTTMDIALTEWRLEPPTGVAVSEVEHVKIAYQDGSTNEIAKADGLAE